MWIWARPRCLDRVDLIWRGIGGSEGTSSISCMVAPIMSPSPHFADRSSYEDLGFTSDNVRDN